MISIELDRGEYLPGGTVRAKIRVRTSKPVKARGVYAELVCNERKRTTERHEMDKYNYDREHELGIERSTHIESHVVEHSSEKYRQEKKIAGEGTYSDNEFEAVFVLPSGGPPTSYEFGHDNKIHKWKLRAKLDIPMALDKNAEKEVFVGGL